MKRNDPKLMRKLISEGARACRQVSMAALRLAEHPDDAGAKWAAADAATAASIHEENVRRAIERGDLSDEGTEV